MSCTSVLIGLVRSLLGGGSAGTFRIGGPIMSRFATLIALAAVFGFGLTRLAPADDAKKADVNKGDAKFIMEAASGGMLEVKLGELAKERAKNADVRRFGERMVTDHTKANKDLMAVADKKGVKFPTELMKTHQETFDKFKDMKPGAEFDRAYMKAMVKDHEDDRQEFVKEAKEAKDDDVKAFAARTLPVIEEHLRMARDIAAKFEAKE